MNVVSPPRVGQAFHCIGAVAVLIVSIVLCGCSDGSGSADAGIAITGPTMGTRYTVKLAELPPGIDRNQLQAEIDAQLETINDQMSTYRPESELSQFNRHVGTDWFQVSAETALVVAKALEISELSGGAFDVTVGPLVKLWGFDVEDVGDQLPTAAEIAEAKTRVGYHLLKARDDPPALRKQQADVYVNLSAIAKGFAVDQIAQLLDDRGVSGYLVEIGGEIRTKGRKADGTGWTVGIERPTIDERSLQRAITLDNAAMATSGDYRNFIEVDGKRYSHTINPKTGRPIEHPLASVTVVADNCMHADALATAIMVLGPEDGYNLAVKANLAVLLIVRGEDGFVERATPAFEKLSDEDASTPMTLFWSSLLIFALAIVAMAVGVIFSNRRLRGTCGGLAGFRDATGRPMCDACPTPSESCTGVDGRREHDSPEFNPPGF